MTPKQQTAKDEINKLAIELIALVNQKDSYTRYEVTTIKNIALRIRYETNHLSEYETEDSE